MQPNIGTNLRNCTLSTFQGVGWLINVLLTKENPKSDLDLDLGFVNVLNRETRKIINKKEG